MPYMSPISGYRQAEEFKAQRQENALANLMNQAKLRQVNRQEQDQAAFRQAASGAIGPNGNIDFNRLIPVMAQSGNIEGAMKLKSLADAENSKNVLRDILGSQATQQSQPSSTYQKYLQVADELSRRGMGDAAKNYYDFAEKFRPELKEQKTLMQNGKRVVVNYYKDGTAEVQPYDPDVEKLHFADTGGAAGVGIDPFTGKQVSTGVRKTMTPGEMATNARSSEANKLKAAEVRVIGGQNAFNAEDKLRDEFNKQVGTFVNVRDAHARVLASAQDPSAAGDLALIFNYMKVLDPGSTVREGEFATAQNAGSVPDRLRSQYNRIMNGERLAPDIRSDFVNRSNMLYERQKQSAEQTANRYNTLAIGYGLRPENVTSNVSLPNKTAPRRGEIQDGYVYFGGDPANPNSWKKVK